MELHNKLRILRKLKGYTQQTISEQFYVSRQAVQKWECGQTSPDISKLLELAHIYGVTVDDLLNIELEEQALLKKALVISESNINSNPDILKIIKKASTIDWLIFSTVFRCNNCHLKFYCLVFFRVSKCIFYNKHYNKYTTRHIRFFHQFWFKYDCIEFKLYKL